MKFDFYSSLAFWGALCVIVVLVRLLGKRPVLRRPFLVVSSALMILAIPGFSLKNFGALFVLTVFSFSVCRVLAGRRPTTGIKLKRAVSTLGILGVLGFLAFYKYGFIQALFFGAPPPGGRPGSRAIFMIGVSYFSFKMIHAIVEAYKGKMDRAPFLTYLSYILFFPSFISGPINRFSGFAPALAGPASTSIKADLKSGAERIVHGLFKKFVLVPLIHPYILSNQTQDLSGLSAGSVLLGLYAYALYFYFDFSGYSDLALGSARLMGVPLPENFNNPFLKRNIRELWTNWHMSLTSWLVDYIYWPLVRRMRETSYLREHPVLLSNAGMIVTFIACGMWHGETANFLVWGVYHGLGISALTIYQRLKRKVANPALQRYFRSRASAIAGAVLTFNFFAVGLAFFVLDLKSLKVVFATILS
ncbi:MAG: Membrane bound O-acyl transferase [Candidatus Aminicenantes bacterium]|nr:Membrane bound O-acyl transferase [Candidatus Aminicenantes bacterium]